MKRFLTLIPFLDAQKILKQFAKSKYQVRSVPVIKSSGYLTHTPVYSRLTIPCSAVSQRDGYAIICSETLAASDSQPAQLTHFSWVHTGSPVPEGYDCVIMQEDVRMDDSGVITIIKPARPGQHIQKAGSEIKTGKMIIPAGHFISPEDIGALIGYGIITVQVRVLTAGLIPTGDELKEPCTAPGPGEVIASNCSMMGACLEGLGIEPLYYPIVPDDPDLIQTAIEQAVSECSFIIISGGSSSGKRDHTGDILKRIGTIHYHGVAIRPGRTTLAAVVDEIPIFGLPGSPAGTLAVLNELIIPWLSDTGYPVPTPNTIDATLAESVPSELGTDDFVQVVVGRVHNRYRAVMVPRGGGQMSTVKSNGILHIPRNSEGLKQDKECLIHLTRSFPHPDNILLFSGVSDPIIDFLDQFLRTREIQLYFRQTSFETTLLTMRNRNFHGGIITRPHINGISLPTSDYSLLAEKVRAITIADREYILAARVISESGTICGNSCPALPDNYKFQMAMEEYLKKHQENSDKIKTVMPICPSEQDIIQRIRNGDVDFGPCSGYLASEYDLNGPVIGCESIDLIIREEDIKTEQIIHIMEILSSDEWKEAVSYISGYNSERSGQVSTLRNLHSTEIKLNETGEK